MIRSISRWPLHAWRPAAMLLVAGLAQAQAQSQPQAPAPPSTPALEHRSVFTTYKGYEDQAVSSWREANDAVARIGGWRTYAKEARQPEGPAASQPESGPESTREQPGSQPGGPGGHHGGKP